ncbi:MAG: hypothetical protein OEY14_07695 [Myxococcales bacterium]|nr:hypothetical protein [Myxococcales bacterium]
MDERVGLSWRIAAVTEAELGERAGAPATIGEFLPVLVEVRTTPRTSRMNSLRLSPPRLEVDGREISLAWANRHERELAPELLAMFPPPAIAAPVPIPEPYHRARYEPSPRPRVERLARGGGGRPGQALEEAITGFLSGLTLGLVRGRGERGSGSSLTPASRRALRQWHRDNEAARATFEAEEARRAEARREEIRQARETDRHRRDARREWRRRLRLQSLHSWRAPSCDFAADEVAEIRMPAERSCQWLALVPREASGPIRLSFETVIEFGRAGACERSNRHELETEGELRTSLQRIFTEPLPASRMQAAEQSVTRRRH